MSFIDRHLYTCGHSEVPTLYHRWACLSLIAAACADRVYITKMKSRLPPNLYIMLIGPSGSGKDTAINKVLKLAARVPALESRIIRGGITKQRLYDILGGRTTMKVQGRAMVQQVQAQPQPYILYPELYNSLGPGGRGAEEFIAALTDLYSGSPVPVTEGTRTWGDVVIKDPTINWLAGTTKDWLIKSVSPDAIAGGFFGRVVAIEAPYGKKRIADPVFPMDHDEVQQTLIDDLQAMCGLSGEMEVEHEARDIRTKWYTERDEPEDEALWPAWRRDDDLVYKLATVLSVAESPRLVLEPRHLVEAQKLVAEARKSMPTLVTLAHLTPETKGLVVVANAIQRAQSLTRAMLTKIASNRGISVLKLDEYVRTLKRDGRIVESVNGRAVAYTWVEATRTVSKEEGDESGAESGA